MFRIFLFLTLVTSLCAQETMFREVADVATDTHIEVLALFSKPSPTGYFPVRVKIANNLNTSRSVMLDFTSKSGFAYLSKLDASSSFRFTAEPRKILIQDILIPLTPVGNTYGQGNSVNATLYGSMGKGENSITSQFSEDQPAVLLSEALFTPNASALDSEVASKFSSSRGSQFSSKFDPKQLPDDWLAFSGFDSILLTDTDWLNTPPGPRNAILSWLRLGGQLIIYTTATTTRAALGLPEDASFGNIQLKKIAADLKLVPAEVLDLVTAKHRPQPQQVSQRENFKSLWPLQNHFGTRVFQYGLFIVVLLIFGVLVGPVNLFVFAKSGQRHRLFFTTPIISLAASAVLIALIIFQDGFGGSGIRRVLMEVRPDSGVNAAFIHQEQFCRTGILTGSNFTLATPVTFQPVAIAASRWARFTDGQGAKGNFNLQPSGGKLDASGDWFRSRSEHGHILSAVTSTRGRIEKTSTPGTFLSTFEFPIQTLYFLDDIGQWHRAEAITTGKSFTLTPVDFSMVDPALTAEANAFAGRNQQLLDKARTRRGHFVAITTAAPGIPTNPSIRWKETTTLITGPVVTP